MALCHNCKQKVQRKTSARFEKLYTYNTVNIVAIATLWKYNVRGFKFMGPEIPKITYFFSKSSYLIFAILTEDF